MVVNIFRQKSFLRFIKGAFKKPPNFHFINYLTYIRVMRPFKKYFSLIVLLMFFTQLSFAQTFNESESNEETIIESDVELSKELFGNFGIGTGTNPRNFQITGNSLFLTQIGEFNSASIITETNASEINISQNGDVNNVELTYVANTAIANLEQNGDYNIIKDFVINRDENISLDLTQEGDGLIFVREGANSLTKSLKFRQTEASPTLIIKSN